MKKDYKFLNKNFNLKPHILFVLVLLVLASVVYVSAQQPPKINAVIPKGGRAGSEVIIKGMNFSPYYYYNTVYFGAAVANVQSCEGDTLIKVIVPPNTTYRNITIINTERGLIGYANHPFRLLFPTSLPVNSESFEDGREFGTGSSPFDIAIGDLDRDGYLDLVVTNYANGTISVMRNITGSYINFQHLGFYTGENPKGVSLADLDGDGRLDIIVANSGDSTITIRRNVSSVANLQLGDTIRFRTGQTPNNVAIGDIDGDGKLDIAVANAGENKLSIFRNTTTDSIISFAPRIDINTSNVNQDIAIGDMNNDGKPDLVSISPPNKLSVFRNTTEGVNISFSSPSELDLNNVPGGVMLADINNDGWQDIAVSVPNQNLISIFLHKQFNDVQFHNRVNISIGDYPCNIDFGDVDGDGRADITVPVYNSRAVAVLQNLCTPMDTVVIFSAPVYYYVDNLPRSVAIGDLNGDGKPELSVVNYGSNNMFVFKNVMRPALEGEYLPDSNTVLLMHLNEAGGSFVRDLSQFVNNGKAFPNAVVTSQGKFGNARYFNGSSQAYMEIPASPSVTFKTNNFTVEFWVKTSDNSYIQRFLFRTRGQSNYFWDFRTISGSGNLMMTISTPTGFGTPVSRKPITDGKWHHVAGIRNGNIIGLYIDGVLNDTWDLSSFGAIDDTIGSIYVGGPGDNCPNGIIDEVRFSNVARSPQEFYLKLPPEGVMAYKSGDDVILTWSESNGAAPLKEYRVYRGTDSSNVSYIGGTSYLIFTDYNPGSGVFYYRVTAVDTTDFESPMSYAVKTIMGDNNPPVINIISVTPKMVDVENGVIKSSLPRVYANAYDYETGMNYFSAICKTLDMLDTSMQIAFPSYQDSFITIPDVLFFRNGRPRGVIYKLVAVDNNYNVSETAWHYIGVANRSPLNSPVQLPGADEFKDDPVKAYRMISVPYDLDDKRPVSILPPSLGDHRDGNMEYARWRFQVYRNIIGMYEDYEGPKFEELFEPGRAFFLIVRDPGRRLQVGSGRTVDPFTMANIGIQLGPGWNLIGNPFDFPINTDWLFFNFPMGGYVGELAYYSGSGPVANGWILYPYELRPWEGLAVWVSNWCTLFFDNPLGPLRNVKNLQVVKPGLKVSALSKSSSIAWLLPIDAVRVDNYRKNTGNVIGMAKDALNGYDNYDVRIPPFIVGKSVVIYFENEEGALIRDIKPVSNEGGIWNMKLVTGDEGADVRIIVPQNLQFPDTEFEVYLIDLDQKMVYDLKRRNEIEVNSGNGHRNFKVVVGKKSFVEENSDGISLVPSEIKLYANYPNPFNSGTVIRYTLPGDVMSYKVIVKIYNMLGQEVARLVDKEQPSGYYEVKWNASNQSTGVYFYMLEVTGGVKKFSEVKKMVYLK